VFFNLALQNQFPDDQSVRLADIENKDFAMTNFTKHRLAFLFSMEYYTTI